MTTPTGSPSADAERIPAYTLMQRVVGAVPELSGFHFENTRVIFHLRRTLTLDGRECDEISIRDVSQYAWMRVADVDWAVTTLRGILPPAQDTEEG